MPPGRDHFLISSFGKMELSNSESGRVSVCLRIFLNETEARLGGVKGGRQVSGRDSLSFSQKHKIPVLSLTPFNYCLQIISSNSKTPNSIKHIILIFKF